ncbi:glycine-rich domain-containing protein 1-like [Bidens hawaiensis]|uniref:glycine-rich domain-containing protein 1-like n=1 Tax=Bidens hawaiensis TaxID=980011 RepID=UPI0040496D08
MSCSDHSPPSTRTLSELSDDEPIRLSLDLVAAARQNIVFLRDVAESHWLHHTHVLVEALRRYDELWMPMISDLTPESGKPPMILPPLDVEWVWFCHTLNPVVYKQYCDSRFSKLIGKPAIFNQENKDYALERCKERWISKYPSESFENEADSDDLRMSIHQTDYLLGEISKRRCLLTKFSKPYMLELVYLIAAKNRYKGFLFMLQKFAGSNTYFVPTLDILLMWITHKSYPIAYAIDLNEMEDNMLKITESECVKEEDLEVMKKLWERVFDQPYEKAGCPVNDNVKPSIRWEVTDNDVNVKYRPLLPRFLLEVNMVVKQTPMSKTMQTDVLKEFLLFQFLRCHREFKLNNPISTIPSDSWQNVVDLYCEFGTKGMVVELRRKGGVCIKGSKLIESKTFTWNELLRAPSITLDGVISQRFRVFVSITPPAQAPYLLKSVPDRVTDDSGAMVSEVILKMNQYRPQEGRWLSRTVLDHAGRECFVIRMRIAGGVWRRGSNKPTVVNWEDRCVEIRAGSWSYVAGSIGKAPEKVVATATPSKPSGEWRALWIFSTGHELLISTDMTFDLKTNNSSTDLEIKLLNGRHLHYQNEQNKEQGQDGFVTIVRVSDDHPSGRATGLINWKLSAMEFLPEEDAAFVLLLGTTILRSVTEMRKEDVGSLLIRRRLKEVNHGDRDWGSVMVVEESLRSVYVKPWYWNAEAVMARQGVEYVEQELFG